MTNRCNSVDRNGASLYPWFKESLRTKCLKDPLQKQQLSGALDGHRWRFLKPGLDDFRDGYPALREVTFTQPQRGTEPAIFGLSGRPASERLNKSRFTKEQVCFSKQNCLQQERRCFVEAVEQRLSVHPLALYPHLASGMAPEVFTEVLSVLDPVLHISIMEPVTCSAKHENTDVVPNELPAQDPAIEDSAEQSSSPIFSKQGEKPTLSRNPYKWQEHEKTKEDLMNSIKTLHSASEEKDIKTVTKHFCDWVASLGGETNNISEATVLSLFASSCEKTPSLNVPIKVLQANQRPEKLRSNEEHLAKNYFTQQLKGSGLNKHQVHTRSIKRLDGTWYSDPKPWKKCPANDPLVTEDLELEQQLTEKDEELKQIHGTQAFKQFIISHGLRMPRFLSSLLMEDEQEDRTRGTDRTVSASTHKRTAMH